MMKALVSIRKHFILLAAVALALPTFAYWTPVQINLLGVAGLPPNADSVYGVRISALYGKCETVGIVDAGFFNRATKSAYGIRAGGINWCEGEGYGIEAGVANVDNVMAGVQIGGFNYAGDGSGLQIGAFNYGADFGGVQIGVINVANKYTGLQIGVFNIQTESVVPFLPLFNVGSGTHSSK